MINTILFDLDGTLLPMNTELFLNSYFKALSSKCAHLIEPKELSTMVLASTECMIRNIDITKTNEQIFMEDFSTRINIDLNNLLPVFDDFYKNDFKHLQSTVQPTAVIKDVIEILKEKGYTMVVATNPLFPREAILQRIQWSGLQESDFALITDYQCMHFCKPNLQYYEEILKLIDKTPGECMMVGN
ncbi:MAG: HAD family hydrolase, partial [Thermotaleaceae bacterium]